MEDDQSWRTATFRQSVVNKINEAISSSDVTPKKNTVEMENHVFSKARNKDEYLSFVARLIIHVREMNTKNKNADGGNQSQVGGPGQQGGIQDPINALQNLTNQGARNVQPPMMGQQQPQPNQGMMMGNQQPQQMMNQQGMIRPQQIPPNQAMNQMPMNPNVKGPNMVVGNQMNPMSQMNQMGPQGNPQQMPPIMNQQLNNPPMMRPTNPMMSPMQNVNNPGQMMNMQQPPQGAQRMMNPGIGPQGPGNFGPQNMPMRPAAPPFSMRQSPSPMGVQSPMSMGASHNAMVPSPAMNVPSPQAPMNQRIPNPMAPSPSANMNTPGQPQGDYVQSPMNPHDDQVYREKYQQLTKYKEPLKRMISRATVENNAEKMQKLKKLLEILSNPETRISLETLLKCEIVLVNQFGQLKDAATSSINNPLYDAIASNLQNPLANHTIQKTFKSSIEAWFGPDIKNLPPAKKRRLSDEEKVITNTMEIPHLLQGEIARLDSKFKISLDQTAHANGSKSIKLICCLDDKLLPCVPTISITIPEDYPMMSPQTTITEHDTPFLKQVENALKARISKLPERFSLTHVLETWVLAIRQACNPAKYVEPTTTSVLMAV